MSINWKNESNYKIYNRLVDLLSIFYNLFDRYLLCLGNKIKYLRKRGVKIGNNCSVITQPKNFGSEPWLIEIGNKVTIANGVVFINHDGASRVFRNLIPSSSKYGNRFGTILVGDNSFVGINSVLLPGTKVGENVIVAAGSVVKGELNSNGVYGGVPAKLICSLEHYMEKYRVEMIQIRSTNKNQLRKELTMYFWKEHR